MEPVNPPVVGLGIFTVVGFGLLNEIGLLATFCCDDRPLLNDDGDDDDDEPKGLNAFEPNFWLFGVALNGGNKSVNGTSIGTDETNPNSPSESKAIWKIKFLQKENN